MAMQHITAYKLLGFLVSNLNQLGCKATVIPRHLYFWNVQLGLYSPPVKIDYILENKQRSNLYYVAFSQSSATFYITTSQRPKYNSKIKLMIALAPVGFNGQLKNHIMRLISTIQLRFTISLTAEHAN